MFNLYVFYNDYTVIQLVLIMLVGTDVCVSVVFECGGGGNRNTPGKPTCLTWCPRDHLKLYDTKHDYL